MAFEGVTREDLVRAGEALGLDLDERDVGAFGALAERFTTGYGRLDALAEAPPAVPEGRDGGPPRPEENPHAGWVWRCSIGGGDGALAGLRVAIKDNIAVAGLPMRAGSTLLEGYAPRADATVVSRILAAGGEIVGKAACPPFCFDGAHVEGHPRPLPVNPRNPDYYPGGSSSGSAVVVVDGDADLALGTDQAGSVRLPASWSGCCGHKPTYGLVPYTGVVPIEMTLDHVGPLARTVEDCARLLDVVAGPDGLDPRQRAAEPIGRTLDALGTRLDGLRVGLLVEGFGIEGISEPDVDELVTEAAHALEALGARVEPVSVPWHRDGLALWGAILYQGATDLIVRGDGVGSNWRGLYDPDLADFLGRALATRADELPDTVKLSVLVGQVVFARHGRRYYAVAQNLARALEDAYDRALADVDLLALPTAATKAFRRPAEADTVERFLLAWNNIHNTAQFDVTGHPAISVPCGFSDGLPVGLMLVGRDFEDATVLRAAYAYQQARG